MIRRILLLGAMATVMWAAPARAQDAPALVEYYGDGVHAYFEGDIFDAYRLLTQAIDGGSQDPRAYYFRGMTLLRMGRQPEAEADMQAGAYLEARAPSGAYDVDRSIQRIQGRNRLLLEKVRRQVRFEVAQQRREQQSLRYEQTRRREEEVLRQQRPEAYDEAVQPAGGAETAMPPAGVLAPPSAATPPQGRPPAATLPAPGDTPPTPQPPTAQPPVAQPPAAQPPAGTGPAEAPPADEQPADDFFTPPAEPAETEEAVDPFGGAFGEQPETEPPSDTPDDPFGGGFGEQPADDAASDPTEADPFGGGFGETTTAPSDMPAAEAMGAGPPIGAADIFRGLGFMLGQASNRAQGGAPPGAAGPDMSPWEGEAAFESEAMVVEPANGAGDPFGGGQDPFGGGQEPFGGGQEPFGAGDDAENVAPPAEGSDPVEAVEDGGTPAPPAEGSDPFGTSGDPFGAGGDPFGTGEEAAEEGADSPGSTDQR